MQKSTKGSLQIILSSMCFGTLPLLTKIAYKGGANATTILTIRFTIASILIWSYLIWTKTKIKTNFKQLAVFATASIFGFGIMAFCYFSSFHYISSSMSAMILFTYPIIVNYLSLIFFKTPITKSKIIALILVIVGAITMSWGQVNFQPLGIFLAVLTTILYSLYIIFLGSSLTYGQEPKILTSFIILFSALFFLIFGGINNYIDLNISLTAWLALIFMAVISTVFAILVFYAGVQKVGSSLSSILGGVEPITAFFLGIILLGEKAGIHEWLGALLIVIGVTYIQLNKPKEKLNH
ncbi:MAG: DMT family transporter [Halanaerobiales bacterium]|nr:DMT family transporter [Halanaerobiales bacterium]